MVAARALVAVMSTPTPVGRHATGMATAPRIARSGHRKPRPVVPATIRATSRITPAASRSGPARSTPRGAVTAAAMAVVGWSGSSSRVTAQARNAAPPAENPFPTAADHPSPATRVTRPASAPAIGVQARTNRLPALPRSKPRVIPERKAMERR